ncbi:thymine dioxygenase [Coprinopsis cinerea okayama7|uniref:Thymine dioxygenase n=1 Tax=Coprinopsis cinerea (strain Okayama-7 / 130 / ATCC MYA-4618 / FGSC 9003) TaxID=240176 RepID=A8PF20_COPC7|nr:thymine dioxygenase [Coprinopsis cinerea okayama7\|eukprot:XP_001840903.2 thymine dioxygenase [Coprinopsis cinerea okayama7\
MEAQNANSLVKTIDFGDFLEGNDSKRVASEILESFKSIGFVCLTNHGLQQEKVDKMFEWSKRFFSLPMETKQLAPHPPSGTHHRGYSAPGVERISQHVYDEAELEALRLKGQDVKESFEAGREDDPLMPNIWLPDGVLPGFKEACLEFYWACYELEKSILRAMAVAFSLPEDYFIQFHKVADNQVRLLHYPSIPNAHLASEAFSRIGAHSDFGTITLLFQDEVGGLEVEDPHNPNTFLPIPVIPNSVVVNAGDFMARWSNDVIKSTIHRVRSPPGSDINGEAPERYSIPYFCCCDLATVVDAVPGTWDETNPKKYKPISAKEYILKRLAALY